MQEPNRRFFSVTKSLNALEQETSELNQRLEQLGVSTACTKRPKLTKSFKGFLRYMLLDMPWYWSKCLWNSRYFRNLLRICIATSIGGLLAFIAHDNAVHRENQLRSTSSYKRVPTSTMMKPEDSVSHHHTDLMIGNTHLVSAPSAMSSMVNTPTSTTPPSLKYDIINFSLIIMQQQN